MAVDNDIPVGSPGLAGFESETWGNVPEHLYSDTPAIAEQVVEFTASGADLEITFLDVLATDGDAAVYNATPSAATANYIAAATSQSQTARPNRSRSRDGPLQRTSPQLGRFLRYGCEKKRRPSRFRFSGDARVQVEAHFGGDLRLRSSGLRCNTRGKREYVPRKQHFTIPPRCWVSCASSRPVSNYWLNLCFGSTVQFDTEEVDFNKIQENRKIAPLVIPTAQGQPIYSAAEERFSLKPAYVKPKDAVSASRVIRRVAGFGELNNSAPMSPQQRYMAIVADIPSSAPRIHRTSLGMDGV